MLRVNNTDVQADLHLYSSHMAETSFGHDAAHLLDLREVTDKTEFLTLLTGCRGSLT